MSKKNEDSVERFFRKAATQQNISFREGDWKNMEKLLDQKAVGDISARSRNLKRAIYTITALTVITSSIYFFVYNPEGRGLLQNPSGTEMQAAAGALAPMKVEKENPTASLLSNLSPDLSSKKNPQSFSDARIHKGRTINGISNNSIDQSMPQAEKNNTASSVDSENGSGLKTDLLPSPVFQTENHNMEAVTKEEESPEKKQPEEKTIQHSVDQTEDQPKEEKEQFQLSRWSIAAVVSPDFSTTALSRYSSPGKAFGIVLGYRIADRFMISSGLIRSSKRYEGYGNEYQPPEGYWNHKTNGVIPNEIKGACEILEIPLVLQFNVIQNPKSRFFVSAGASSYRMLSESYKYSFDTPNPGAANGWSSSKDSFYAFSIGHFSLGYERQVTNRIAIGIEPYLKMPFAGIGWSKISLYSTGAYINIRYRMFKKEVVSSVEEKN